MWNVVKSSAKPKTTEKRSVFCRCNDGIYFTVLFFLFLACGQRKREEVRSGGIGLLYPCMRFPFFMSLGLASLQHVPPFGTMGVWLGVTDTRSNLQWLCGGFMESLGFVVVVVESREGGETSAVYVSGRVLKICDMLQQWHQKFKHFSSDSLVCYHMFPTLCWSRWNDCYSYGILWFRRKQPWMVLSRLLSGKVTTKELVRYRNQTWVIILETCLDIRSKCQD